MAFSNLLLLILLQLLFVYFKTCNALSAQSQVICRLRIVAGEIGVVRLLTTNAMLNRIKRCGHIESKDQSCTAPLVNLSSAPLVFRKQSTLFLMINWTLDLDPHCCFNFSKTRRLVAGMAEWLDHLTLDQMVLGSKPLSDL